MLPELVVGVVATHGAGGDLESRVAVAAQVDPLLVVAQVRSLGAGAGRYLEPRVAVETQIDPVAGAAAVVEGGIGGLGAGAIARLPLHRTEPERWFLWHGIAVRAELPIVVKAILQRAQ